MWHATPSDMPHNDAAGKMQLPFLRWLIVAAVVAGAHNFAQFMRYNQSVMVQKQKNVLIQVV